MKLNKTLALTTTLLCAGFVCAQAAKPAPKRDPKIKEALKSYKKMITDRKAAQDAKAIDVIDSLYKQFPTMHPKDRADTAKGLAESLLSLRCKRKPSDSKLYKATITALGHAGKDGAKYLKMAYGKKAKFKGKEWYSLRSSMLENVGRTKDSKSIDFLLDEALKSPRDPLMASAGGALKHFKGEKLAVRKKISKLLIKKFAQIYSNANQNLDPGDLNRRTWENRLARVSDPWNTALQALTKQNLRSPNDWNTFWNKEKGRNWDKPKTRRR